MIIFGQLHEIDSVPFEVIRGHLTSLPVTLERYFCTQARSPLLAELEAGTLEVRPSILYRMCGYRVEQVTDTQLDIIEVGGFGHNTP